MANRGLRSIQGARVTPAEFHILLALADEDRHGYAIMRQVESDSGGRVRLGPGTLYTAIKRLLDQGFVREVESLIDPELDDSRRRYYRLTARGRAAVKAEAQRLDELVHLARARQAFEAAAGAKGGRT